MAICLVWILVVLLSYFLFFSLLTVALLLLLSLSFCRLSTCGVSNMCMNMEKGSAPSPTLGWPILLHFKTRVYSMFAYFHYHNLRSMHCERKWWTVRFRSVCSKILRDILCGGIALLASKKVSRQRYSFGQTIINQSTASNHSFLACVFVWSATSVKVAKA